MTPVARAAEILDVLYLREIHHHRVSRLVWSQLREPLSRYPAGKVFFIWYRDSVLAGCRRLVDRDKHSQSLVAALMLLRDHASDVTEEVVIGARARHRDGYVRAELARHAQDALVQVGHEVEGRLLLDPDHVERDLNRIDDLARDIWRHATRTVAHRDPRPVPEVSEQDVDELLAELVTIHARWYSLLKGSTPDDRIDHLVPTRDLETALRLFDWREYVEALGDAEQALGPAAPPSEFERLERAGSVIYRFGE